MRIAIVGDGPLAEVLSRAVEQVSSPSDADIVILAGSRVSSADVDAVAGDGDRVIVDATERAVLSTPPREARVVRAFASVPSDALAAAIDGSASAKLGVPFAGDDRDAKVVVAKLMRDMGLEPFDLGSLNV